MKKKHLYRIILFKKIKKLFILLPHPNIMVFIGIDTPIGGIIIGIDILYNLKS